MKPGDSIDRYRIMAPIGEGGMGRVFHAHDERLDRPVALKMLLAGNEEEGAKARLLREARAVAKLDHPNIVAVYDVGEHEGTPYVAMELVSGRSLREIVADPSVSPEEKTRILGEMAAALTAAHAMGIVHRDIKPENILVRPDGRVKVLDFGIARRSSVDADPSAPTDISLPTLTQEGAKIGTPMYMAPEQIRGLAVDGRADQFAWAVTAYELFAGQTPWRGDSMNVIASIMTDVPERPPAMPESLWAVVSVALSKAPAARFASMAEVRDRLTPKVSPTPAPEDVNWRLPPSLPTPRSFAEPTAEYPSVPPAPSGPRLFLARRYTSQELADIFDRAVLAQGRSCRADEILAAGRDVGVDDLSMRAALAELSRRGIIERSSEEIARDRSKIHRYLAYWGLILLFFVLADISRWNSITFPVPTFILGIPFGLKIIRILFPKYAERATKRTADLALEHDVDQVARVLHDRAMGPAAMGPGAMGPAAMRVAPAPLRFPEAAPPANLTAELNAMAEEVIERRDLEKRNPEGRR